MSKTEETTAKEISFDRSYAIFDKDLNEIEKTVTVKYVEVTDTAKAVEFLSNNQELYVDAANAVIRKKALSDAKAEAGLSGGINREVLMEFIKPYREMPQFASMITATDKRKATAPEWNAQTRAILDQIKNVPFIMNGILERSKAAEDKE